MESHARARSLALSLALSLIGVAVTGVSARAEIVDEGGGPAPIADAPCVSVSERAWAENAIRAYRAARQDGPPAGGAGTETPAKFTFFPMAGGLYRDVYTNNFVDLEPSGGIREFNCTNHTYNGHRGIDTDLRSFAEQDIGVPVFAALAGTVVAVHDGEFDMNTSCVGTANSVIIDHGHGRFGYYWHLKNGSITAFPGFNFPAGKQIGECGSSGCSTGPHLHFEVHDDGEHFEPHAGACRDGESEWEDQTPIRFDTYVRDLGVTHEDLTGHPGWPHPFPASGQIATSDAFTRVWFIVHNLPADSTRRWEFVRPDGTVAWSSSISSWENPPYRWSWWWFGFNIAEMHSITGQWTVRLEINDEQVAEFPIEVVTERDPLFNRAPEPVTVALEPYGPDENSVISARITSDLVVDDADYDVLRYRYQWTVDDRDLRDVVTAAHSDVLPSRTAEFGSIVRCRVTPDDGTLTAPAASADVIVRSTCVGDVNDNGIVDVEDIVLVLPHWGACDDCLADIDANGVVDVADIVWLLGGWGACEEG